MMSMLLLASPAERQLKALANLFKNSKPCVIRPVLTGMKTFGSDEQLYRVGERDYRILYTSAAKNSLCWS
jgi:hypothetical protein